MSSEADNSILTILPDQPFVDWLEERMPGIETPHITLVYPRATTPQEDLELQEVARKSLSKFEKPLTIGVNGVGMFKDTGDDGAPFYVRHLLMNGIGLDILRAELVRDLWRAGFMGPQKYGFIPHLTISYHDEPLEPGWESPFLPPAPEFSVSEIIHLRHDEVLAELPFGLK